MNPIPVRRDDCTKRGRFGDFLAIGILLIAVVLVYFPPFITRPGTTLVGNDYWTLHQRRIRYAQEALFGPKHYLPGWYSRELMGTPFSANIQSFPLIPTRLILLAFDPWWIFPIGVELSASLAALFAYFYARQIRLGRIASCAAGFTFACTGFFASRVMAGHLPLLEAYPSLPLLLWLVEKVAGARSPGGWWMLCLGLVSGMIALAGHPQLPAYALITAVFYAMYRMPDFRGLRTVGAIMLGFGCSAFALWPLMMLLRLSTRSLPLDPALNNIQFPFGRLKAFVFPWGDGAPDVVNHFPKSPFIGYPDWSYFWDTICYIGLLPIFAGAVLIIRALVRRKAPPAPWPFLALIGALALLLALPFAQRFTGFLPTAIFRSPARQIYVTLFALALGLAGAIDLLLRQRLLGALRFPVLPVAIALLVFHAMDLVLHDRAFIKALQPPWTQLQAQQFEKIRSQIGNGRVAIQYYLNIPPNRQTDDLGFFDSIMLAKPYVAMLDVQGLPPTLNVEYADMTDYRSRALAFGGVKVVITSDHDGKAIDARIVPSPSLRTEFFPLACIEYADSAAIHAKLRDPNADVRNILMLPTSQKQAFADSQIAAPAFAAKPIPAPRCQRPTSDEFVVSFNAPADGYLRLLESWHPGWRATVDGVPRDIICADDTFMAVRLSSGTHTVRFSYSTPGRSVGMMISLVCLALLATGSFLPVRR